MMQTPVRYYITKDHDQPVVRTIPVALPAQPRPSVQDLATIQVPASSPAPARTRVKAIVRAAMHRPSRQRTS